MNKLNFSPFPTLHTERLTLRKMTPGDADELLRLRSDERVIEHLGFLKMTTREQALRYIEKMKSGQQNNEFLNWVVSSNDDLKFLGTVVIWNISTENHRAETGYMLHHEFQGKGYMNEAMKQVIKFGFNTIGLHSIEAIVSPENKASVQLLSRLDFVKEAHFKESVFSDGRYSDSAVYSLLSETSQ